MLDKLPFIDDQGLWLLEDVPDPRPFLKPELFRQLKLEAQEKPRRRGGAESAAAPLAQAPEWCRNFAADDASPTWAIGAPASARVLRGGSWGIQPGYVRSGLRDDCRPSSVNAVIGFRVARALPRKA